MGIFMCRSEALIVPFFLLLSLFTCNVSATTSTQAADDICNKMFCGKGTCQASDTELLGFRCDCDSGWKKIQVGVVELPPCLLPNCTVDTQCGNGSLSQLQPPVDPSDPCLLNFCGDGTCERIGSGFRCQCNEGSANLLNDPKMICLNKCALGADCHDLDIGFHDSPDGPTPPAQQNNGPGGTGSSGAMLNGLKELQMLMIMISAIIFNNWF